jgi:Rrf2 family protein
MLVTQKKQYALRALFELARRSGRRPVKAAEIAESQAIPLRFLEVILNQLKRAGLVRSKRGFYGGYTLTRPAEELTVGDVFRHLEEPEVFSDCVACTHKKNCPFIGDCVFMDMWDRVHEAMYRVYDDTTLRQLVENERLRRAPSS